VAVVAAARSQAAAAPKRNGAAPSGQNGAHRGPVGRMQTVLATALKDDPDWKEF
jgi:hypothetical protein